MLGTGCPDRHALPRVTSPKSTDRDVLPSRASGFVLRRIADGRPWGPGIRWGDREFGYTPRSRRPPSSSSEISNAEFGPHPGEIIRSHRIAGAAMAPGLVLKKLEPSDQLF